VSKLVLIAEDEESIVATLQFLMQKSGYRTVIARDGESALTEARHDPPDLVLLDVMLPIRSGLEVCKALRADARLASTHVVMLTARTGSGDTARGYEAGANDYLLKPFSTRELLAKVKAVLA
jgi:DNA-binding response OmpR family regulator